MDLERLRVVAYVIASLCFVLSLRGLSTQATARAGNRLGAIGMILAVVATLTLLLFTDSGALAGKEHLGPSALVAAAIGGGAVIGAMLAGRVAMTAMPELVAILHSFVGAAAVLVGIGTHLVDSSLAAALGGPGAMDAATGGHGVASQLEIWIGVFVGSITFTGSVVAFLKLRGTLGSKPTLLPGRHALNLALVLGCGALGAWALKDAGHATLALVLMTVVSGLLGVHLVAAIGGGDMPVVVSLLNSYSGWAASAAGFMLSNDLLIITGALVGASGAILSTIMCRAMNRSIWNVVFGGFGAEAPKGAGGAAAAPQGKVTETNVAEVADLLLNAKEVVIVPGYGMAVAQAQHPVKEITTRLASRGVKVRYAIHPVAGRLPGHMNVLLAEADVSYEIVKEMEEINHELGSVDVVIVIGANDIVNPSAMTDRESPIYGMPVLEVWNAAKVVMLKRGMAAGYAGVDNPLCYRENTLMLFGDAKQSVSKLLAAVEAAAPAA